MELQKIVFNLDRSNPMEISIEAIADEMGLPHGYDFDWDAETDLKQYWIRKHYCTDTWVGVTAIFYKDAFVGITSQSGRKMDVEYEWVSKALYKEVRDYVLTLCVVEDDDEEIPLLDLTYEMGQGYKVSYGGSLLDKIGIYEPTGETVEVVKTWGRYDEIDKWGIVEAKFPDGKKKEIKLSDYLIPYPLVVSN